MRQIGFLSSPDDAERFADFLRADGVKCSVDAADSGFRIWIQEDDHVPAAREELARFLADPSQPRYRDASQRAKVRMQEDQLRRRTVQTRQINVADRWVRPSIENSPVTFALIAMSVVVGYFSSLSPKIIDPEVSHLFISTDGTFRQIMNGEVWRLVTPIFLHFGLMHLLFNMLITYQLGLAIEFQRGSLNLVFMSLAIAIFSNIAQFVFGGSPNFGGMSGVDYGLFGYVWIKGRLDPRSGFYLPREAVTMMLAQYLLGVVEVLPHMANWCHGIGLVTGVAIALIGTGFGFLFRRR
jgi:GlpG protein